MKKPFASFTVNPEVTSILNPTIDINDISISTTMWMWDFGDGSKSPVSNLKEHTYADTGTYKISLVASNLLCKDSTYQTIKIILPLMLYVPNTFTPNGDGHNDIFKAEGDGILKFEMLIYNRWGRLIFTSEDINKGWNGKVNGGEEITEMDTFVYVINLKALSNKHDYTYRGTVTLIK